MNFFRRAPLFVILLITFGIMTGVAVYGKYGTKSFADYDADPVQKPLFSVVFQGMHDGVFVWGRQESEAQRQARLLLEGDDKEGSGTDGATSNTKDKTTGTDGAAGRDGQETAGNGQTGNGQAEQADGATDGADVVSAQESGQEKAGANTSSGETSETSEISDAAASARAAREEAARLTIPSGVNNEVVPAKDYGNNNTAYLTPEGETWQKDTTDIFASNGTYYKLQAVDDGYFQDAIFIGDSRTEGLYVYSSLRDKTTFDAKDSLTIFKIYDTSLDYYGIDGTTGSMTAMEALQAKQYRKVYFSVGINELGMPTQKYFDAYREFIQVIRKLQPDAIIYIEGIMHVTGDYAQANSVYNNVNIVDKNTALATLANGHDIFYIDMNSAVCDENGEVPADMSYDGVHLKASAYEKWHEFLKENAIVRTDADWTPLPASTDTDDSETAGSTSGTDAASSETTGGL